MDAQAERRFQTLKRKLEALQYMQPLCKFIHTHFRFVLTFILIAMDSAALAEKLLNDMLKATEAFNKLKKINDDLKNNSQPNQREKDAILQ
jgi:hypothetical protein